MKTTVIHIVYMAMLVGCGAASRPNDSAVDASDLAGDVRQEVLPRMDAAPPPDCGADDQVQDAVHDSRLPDESGDAEAELRDGLDGDELEVSVDLDALQEVGDVTADTEVQQEYPCPAGLDGKKDLMPSCPYDDVFLLAGNVVYNEPVQFELFDESVSPGLPDGFELSQGQEVVLLRVRWTDFWTDTYVDTMGCPPEWPGCKGCGGHCFPHQDYVYVIDIDSQSVVFAAKETFPGKKEPKPCSLSDGNPLAFCWEVEIPSHETTIRFSSLGSNSSGTANVTDNNVQVYQGTSWTFLGSIPLPLF